LLLVTPLLAACEQLGIKAKIVTTTTKNGQTTVKEREAKNWAEFEEAMGEVATDFSSFAKDVGATTAELVKKLVDVPPPGKVKLSALDPSLAPFEGDIRYDYIKVATSKPNPEYDFSYVQLGVKSYDTFFKASAEMYATAYQLVETGRHIHVAAAKVSGGEPDSSVESGKKRVPKADVDKALSALTGSQEGEIPETAKKLEALWGSLAKLGINLAGKVSETVQAGTALVASAPTDITNPKMALHIDLIVKGLKQSVALVKDTGVLFTSVVG
jgi:hypothetical protein